jgi:hypothetical protein
MISEEMFAAVIDGAATREERRLVYKAIEGDDELRQTFNDCMYLKVFEDEIESDFKARHAGAMPELEPAAETQDSAASMYNRIRLSINDLVSDSETGAKERTG